MTTSAWVFKSEVERLAYNELLAQNIAAAPTPTQEQVDLVAAAFASVEDQVAS